MKNDKYRKIRGGYSRILQLFCSNCDEPIFKYQKDGSGILKRLYLDRILDSKTESKNLTCPKCKEVLGVRSIYEKEKRPTYRLFVGAILRKIIKR